MTTELPDGVSEKDVRRYSKLAGVVKALNKKHGQGKWTDADVATYIAESKAKKLHALEHPPARPIPSWVPPADFQKRLDEYLATYDKLTANDRQSFATLVTLELNMERIRQDLLIEDDGAVRSKLTESLSVASREHRQVQEALGIGRAKRKSEASAQDEIERLRSGAARFLSQQTAPIRCADCKSGLNLGFVAYHFKDDTPWKFESVCPKCGGRITLAGALDLPAAPPPQVFTLA